MSETGATPPPVAPPPGSENAGPPSNGAMYGAFVHLAIHGQENKWWMMYIYLVFNTILVLSCSTVLVANPYGLAHQLILTVFCTAGFFFALCWLFMVPDYVRASDLYGRIVREAERGLPAGVGRPLNEREEQRT